MPFDFKSRRSMVVARGGMVAASNPLAALQALNIAEGWSLGDMAWDDPARLHLMIEAVRLAFADAGRSIADMARVDSGVLFGGSDPRKDGLVAAY